MNFFKESKSKKNLFFFFFFGGGGVCGGWGSGWEGRRGVLS